MATLLASVVIAAAVSAFIGFVRTERQIAAKNINRERRRWRGKIRSESLEIFQAMTDNSSENALDLLREKLKLKLNPHDSEDQAILDLVNVNHTEDRNEFMVRISLLLKHDWERAKRETSFWQTFVCLAPERVDFVDYRPGMRHAYRRPRFC